jgi:hypothetical protein
MKTLNVNYEAPFWEQLKDENAKINFNGNLMPVAYYNLVVSIRDVKLYAKGIKINRHWKISDVKSYFGVKGGAEAIAYQLEYIKDVLTNTEEQ